MAVTRTMSSEQGYPFYAELPISPEHPAGSSWGVFGDDDSIGTLNRLDREAVTHAARLVVDGKVFPLNWGLDRPVPAFFGRKPPIHHVVANGVATDDYFDSFYPQSSSQWDALCHIQHPEHGYYNRVSRALTPAGGGTRLGIQNWATRGIAGRFVLLDIARYRAHRETPLDYAVRTEIYPTELDEIAQHQGVTFRDGDILLLRFGWTQWYDTTPPHERDKVLTVAGGAPSPGLAATEDTARWLWDNGFAAVASDTPALEATPFDVSTVEGFLHYRLIPLLGMAIGELFDLRALANQCAKSMRFDGLLTSAPLNQPGGAGSPANALALV